MPNIEGSRIVTTREPYWDWKPGAPPVDAPTERRHGDISPGGSMDEFLRRERLENPTGQDD